MRYLLIILVVEPDSYLEILFVLGIIGFIIAAELKYEIFRQYGKQICRFRI